MIHEIICMDAWIGTAKADPDESDSAYDIISTVTFRK